jgi:hypothetical protein
VPAHLETIINEKTGLLKKNSIHANVIWTGRMKLLNGNIKMLSNNKKSDAI